MNSLAKSYWLAMVTAVCMVVVIFGHAIPPLRAVAGALLVLVIPGSAITRALFPAHAWGTAERILFTLGGSLCLAVASGLVLNWTRWGMQTVSWTLFLGSISLIAAVTGAFRKHENQGRVVLPAHGVPRHAVALLVLSGLMIASAYGIAAYGALLRPTAQFTQLWMLPAKQERSVQIGIRNEERAAVDYRLILRAGVDVVQEWPRISLHSGEEWETVVTLAPSQASTLNLVASLYRQDEPNMVYRYVTLRSPR